MTNNDERAALSILIGQINRYEPNGGAHPVLHTALERYLAALPAPGVLEDYQAAREARFTDEGLLRPTEPAAHWRLCAGCGQALSEKLRAVHGRVRSVVVRQLRRAGSC